MARDEVFLYPSATRMLLRGYKTAGQGENDPLHDLSEREREVPSWGSRTARIWCASPWRRGC